MSGKLAFVFTIFILQMTFVAQAQEADGPTAVLRSASFVTRDLDTTVNSYTGLLGYKVLGESEVTAEKSRQVVGAKGDEAVRYVSLAPAAWTKEDNR